MKNYLWPDWRNFWFISSNPLVIEERISNAQRNAESEWKRNALWNYMRTVQMVSWELTKLLNNPNTYASISEDEIKSIVPDFNINRFAKRINNNDDMFLSFWYYLLLEDTKEVIKWVKENADWPVSVI